MDQGKIFKDILKVFLKPLGFKKSKSRWHLYHDEVIVVIELHRSSWGPQYYFEIGLYLRPLGDLLTPTEVQCHIRTRLATVCGQEDKGPVGKLFDLEHQISDKDRSEEIVSVLEQSLIPFLNTCTSLKDLSQHFISGFFRGCFVHKDVALVIKEHRLLD